MALSSAVSGDDGLLSSKVGPGQHHSQLSQHRCEVMDEPW